MSDHYVRICPVCGTAESAEATQCGNCGTLLLGVDLTLRQAASTPAVADTPPPAAELRCPHADCAQANPPGSESCLYCGRPLQVESATNAVPPAPTFYRLPAALAGKFSIVEVLPAGGAEAEIMILTGKETGVKVIAKIYRPGMTPKTDVLERVGRAAFPHVVRLIAWGESDGIGYEVMEYCPDGSLRQLMAAGPLPRDVLRDILDEVSAALAALHELNVIHRDLKPENILVRRREPLDLVLTDFGIASVNDATQRFTSIARTVRYGAPETLTGVLDRAADWWSLGMILVELLTGRHPFEGLSDAVITHQLVTGSVDLAGVDDPEWRKLCRGLLLRDPKRRWGNAEIRRWLDGDASQPAPQEDTAPAPQAARPYRIGDAVCHTPAELAAALALNWDSGRKDLMRGQLSAWIGQELRDDNLLRFVQDLLEHREASDDLRLLWLIRHLAPGMPPAWRGESLALANVVARAAQAAKGDAAASEWLVPVLTQKILRELPVAEFPAEAAFAARWDTARARFTETWRTTDKELVHWRRMQSSQGGFTNFDALVFGQPEVAGLPPPQRLFPALVLLLADDDHANALRERIRGATAPWLADNPWLEALLADEDPVAWLVADFNASLAQGIAEDARQREHREAEAAAAQFDAMTRRSNEVLAVLRDACELGLLAGPVERGNCAAAAQQLLQLVEEARRESVPDEAPLMRTLRRAEPIVLRIQERLDAWEHAARINAALRNRNLAQGVGGFLFIAVIFAIEIMPAHAPLWVLLVIALVAGWRIWGLLDIRGDLRDLGRALPVRVAAARQ